MLWVIIGIAALVVFVVCTVLLLTRRDRAGDVSECRPDYQEVIVRDAVDVSTQQYVSGVGAYFPNVDGMQSTPTIIEEGGAHGWYIVFRDMSTGKKYRKAFAGQLVLGRDPATRSGESRLLIADDLVSKSHCMITGCGDSAELRDLGSKNGTFLNGNRVVDAVPVRSGDRLEIGRTSMDIQIIRE